MQDDGGVANGGVDLDATPRTMTVNVTSVNDAPVGTSKTVTVLEDALYTFAAADFGFTDLTDAGSVAGANALANVRITTVPGAGALALSGVAVTAGQFVSVANINAGNLKFTPAANANGAGYASFTFQVQDDGGTANGGVDLDAVARTMTVNVTSVNDAPVGTSKTVTVLEDAIFTFAAADFGFTDPSDAPVNALASVRITTVPGAGTLALSGVAVTAGQFVSVANINAGNLKFTPAVNANGAGYASFTFLVQDDGGTANGGVDLDATPRTMTVNVTPVNDAPAGASGRVSMLENTAHTFTAANFGYTDAADAGSAAGADALSAVKITTLPGAGALTDNGVNVIAGQFVTVADVNAGKLVFTPAAHGVGAGYATFTFQVQDAGGTANGGVDLDPTPRTMTADVNAVPAAPAVIVIPPPPVVVPPPVLPPPVVVISVPPAPIASSSVTAKSADGTVPAPDAIVVNAPALAYVLTTDTAPPPPPFAQSPPGVNAGATGITHVKALELQKLDFIDAYATVTAGSAPVGISIGVASAGAQAVCGARNSGMGQSACEEPTENSGWIRGGVQVTGVVVSAGFVVWAMRGAGLLTSILSAAPAWRHLDPMPVLAPEEEKPDWGDEADDENKREDAAASKLWRDDSPQVQGGRK